MRLLAIAAMTLLLGLAGAAFIVWPSVSSQFTAAAAQHRLRTQLVFEIDREAIRSERLEAARERLATVMRVVSPAIPIESASIAEGAVRLELADSNDTQRALSAAGRYGAENGALGLDIASPAPGVLEARVNDQQLEALAGEAASQNAEIVRRRLASFGDRVSVEVTERNHIRVNASAVDDMNRLRTLVGETGLLTFHLVREVAPKDMSAGALPINTILAPPHPIAGDNAEVVERRVRLTGDELARAHPSTDPQTGEFVLSFQLNSEGARRFCRITRDHTGERFAILLDGQVLTAPRINEAICGGSGQISGNFTAESATTLAILLRAGALAAPMKLIEESAEQQP
ncbi:MAG TPA: hypothetical protein VEA80_15540 [Vitreimonas sp.]|uniref:preprotein translocase subunit SecD n=1 Tax=Vitreimonas sp. TaxID=3069702 RepID=UPI002D2F880A|nr:hypothetical protein [Vitreimonas sp.]HYD88887.1 hypothetical protein [Vitreimonas sp.]